jgi:hypothetical protein
MIVEGKFEATREMERREIARRSAFQIGRKA